MSLQGEANVTGIRRQGMVEMTKNIIRQEGIRGMYAGLTPAILRQFVYGGLGVSMYVPIRNLIIRGDKENATVGQKILAAMVTGGLGQWISSPTDVVKVRLQADRRFVAQGIAPRYNGTLDAIKKIYKEGIARALHASHSSSAWNGVKYFWTGSFPNMQRAAVINGASVATYDHIKFLSHRALGHSSDYATTGNQRIEAQVFACMLSGMVAAVVSTPYDVIKNRIMNQGAPVPGSTAPAQLYTSSLDCFRKTVRNEGFLALYKGFTPAYLRLAPWQMIFYLTYEAVATRVGIEVI